MDASTAPAIGVSFQIDLGTGRQIVSQTHVPQDIAKEDFDALLDRMGDAAERQRQKYLDIAKLEELRRLLENQERQYESFSDDFNRLEKEMAERHASSGRRGLPEPKGNEAIQRKNSLITLERGKKDIGKTKAQIADLEAKVSKGS